MFEVDLAIGQTWDQNSGVSPRGSAGVSRPDRSGSLRAAEETLPARLTVEGTEWIVALVVGADQEDDVVPG